MPLYKKSSTKGKVKTQNSFVSPLLNPSQNKVFDLIKDDYKENLPIPTKKKLLEPLINIAYDGDLFDKLQQKSFSNLSKTSVEVSKAKETWSGKNKDATKILNNNKTLSQSTDTSIKESCLGKSTKYETKPKELSKTLLNLNTESPILFNSPSSSSEKCNKRLKSESSMTITTKIEISSNNASDLDTQKNCETPNSQLSDMLNECVMNNLRMSQQFLNLVDEDENKNMKITKESDDTKIMQIKTDNFISEDEEKELDASLRWMLDDIVNTNIILSQKIMNDDADLKSPESKTKITEFNKETKKNKKQNDKNLKLERKLKTKVGVKKAKEKSKETVETLVKLKEKIKILKQSKKIKNQKPNEDDKKPSYKRIRALCSNEDNLEQPATFNIDLLKDSRQTKKSTNIKVNQKVKKDGTKKKNTTDEKLKQKVKEKYLRQKSAKSKNESDQNSSDRRQNQNQEKKKNETKIKAEDQANQESKKYGGRKLKKKKSFNITNHRSSNVEKGSSDTKRRGSCLTKGKSSQPPRPNNMIFTSANPKKNEIKLNELLTLQEERDIGLYVYCDTCDKVRYLQYCKDPLELPAKWHCYMNPDPKYNKCSDPNFDVELEKEELIIFNKFNAGSIVWAKMDGYPWWPAMVDDDPDLTDYFWIDDEDSKEPSWYHVTFFDSSEVTRAWIRTASLEPFEINAKNSLFKPKKFDIYRHRVDFAIREAKTACKMKILERLRLYSFCCRYFKKHNDKVTHKSKTRGRSNKNNTKKMTKDLVEHKGKDESSKNHSLRKDMEIDENSESCDNLSIASSDISNILRPKKSGKFHRLASDDILENIDLNHFICNEDAFEML